MDSGQVSLRQATDTESATVTWEPLSEQQFPPGELPYRRQNVLKIDRDDAKQGVVSGPGHPFASAFADSLDDLDEGGIMELLCYAGREQWQTYVSGYPANPALDIDTESAQTPDEELSMKLRRKFDRQLSEAVSIRRCNLDLRPIGRKPLATCRLVLPTSHEPTRKQALDTRPVFSLWAALHRRLQTPFIYQVLLRKDGANEYLGTVRLAVIDNQWAVGTEDGFFHFYNNLSDIVDLADYFKYAEFTSNFWMPLSEYYKFIGELFAKTLQTHSRVSRYTARRARYTKTGAEEWGKLFRADMGYDNCIEQHLGYPKFPIRKRDLPHFLGFLAMPYAEDPWQNVRAREPPTETITGEARSTPDQDTQRSPTASREPVRQQRAGTSATEGSDEHQLNLRGVLKRLRQQGYVVVEIEQDGASIPDAIGWDQSGKLVWIEYENTLSKPENVLKNAARAAVNDITVVFANQEKDNLKDIINVLAQPYQECTDRGAYLYNRSASVRTDAGHRLLLPEGASEVKWYACGETMAAYADGDCLGDGSVDESISSIVTDCPHVEKTDGIYIVVASNGSELAHYETKAALTDEWTFLNPPHVPVGHHYLGRAKFFHVTWGSLEQYDPDPLWGETTTGDGGRIDTYEQMAEEWFAKCTLEREDEYILISDAYQAFKRWARPQTSETLPSRKQEFGEAIEDLCEKRRKGAGGKQGKAIENRMLVYPPDTVSPALPDFDENLAHQLVEEHFEEKPPVIRDAPQ